MLEITEMASEMEDLRPLMLSSAVFLGSVSDLWVTLEPLVSCRDGLWFSFIILFLGLLPPG